MRLSWYADTGVAVFSIWQGGKCTGTFRLPIDDLPRMVEILQRGPDSRRTRPPGPPEPDYGPPDQGQGYGDDTAYFQDGGYGQDYRQHERYGHEGGDGPDPGYSGGPDDAGGPDYDGGLGAAARQR